MLLHEDLLRQGDEVFLLLTRLRGDDDFLVTAFDASHGHLAVDLAHDGGVRRVTSLEELGDTRQTTGDITTLGHTTRNLHQCGTCAHHLSVFDHHVATHGEVVGADHCAVLVDDVASRHLGAVLGVDDDFLSQSRGLIGLSLEGDALLDVVEPQATRIFGDDDSIEGVPLGDERASLDLVVGLEVERATIRHIDRGEHDVGIGIDETHLGETADHHLAHLAILLEGHGTQLVELKASLVLRHDGGVGGGIGSHTTGVERTEGKLCTRLADGLCGDDTHGLAHLHHAARG